MGWDSAQLLQEGTWLLEGVSPWEQRGELVPGLHTWAQGLHEGVVPGAKAGPGRHRGERLADETPQQHQCRQAAESRDKNGHQSLLPNLPGGDTGVGAVWDCVRR